MARRAADYLDDLDLPEGSVLTDMVLTFGVITASENPKQFVITSDTDFVQILNNPWKFGVQYVLTVPKEGRGAADAINRRYPTMYETGSGGIGALVIEVENDGGHSASRLAPVSTDWKSARGRMKQQISATIWMAGGASK